MKGKTRGIKPVYIEQNLWEKVLVNLKKISQGEQTAVIKTYSRNSTILPQCVGMTFLVHNGKTFLKVYISDDMIGHKLGEFVLTRKLGNQVKATNVKPEKKKSLGGKK